jgi:hypothetical protein
MLSGCAAASEYPTGPLQFHSRMVGVCAPLPRYSDVVIGNPLKLSVDKGPVTIDSVKATGASGVRVGRSYLMILPGSDFLILDHFPPTQYPAAWKGARVAKGSELAGGTNTDLVTRLIASNKTKGRITGLTIVYTTPDGTKHQTSTKYHAQISSTACPR